MLYIYLFENDCIAAMSDLSNLCRRWELDNASVPDLFSAEIRAKISSQFHKQDPSFYS